VFAYGTLMHRDSLARTPGFTRAESDAAMPATIEGYQRCFCLPYPWWGRVPSLRLSVMGRERAAAALRPQPGGQVNGLLLWVDAHQLQQLDRREGVPWRYRRASTTAVSFPDGQPLGAVWLYLPKHERPPHPRLLPHWLDLAYARRAAYAVSAVFGRVYDATTFLADQQQLVAEHYTRAPRFRRAFAAMQQEPAMRWHDLLEKRLGWALVLLLLGYDLSLLL
jgi:gamma-glutamylcyclotransferase (GGCT)/AIG2-like uncharacterized protein YtfP